jgi:hypothetical protein
MVYDTETGRIWGKIGGATRAARHGSVELGRTGQRGLLRALQASIDPDGTLPVIEREKRLKYARRAYMLRLAQNSHVARRANKEARLAAQA